MTIINPAHCELCKLEGQYVQLEPLSEKHREELRAAAKYEEIWTFMPQKPTLKAFDHDFDSWLAKMKSGEQITYSVRRKACHSLVGATSYYEVQLQSKCLVLGCSWFIPKVWGTEVNPESKLLMLAQAFESWRFCKIEIGTDTRNSHSYNAIKKLGATKEGILRNHMILHDGLLTDTALFSINSRQWPGIKEKLMHRLLRAV